jgi:two-component sensor histidine kinase
MREQIDHRARNLLTLMAGLVRLTSADTIDDYKTKLLGRLDSLARSQHLLARGRDSAVDLADLIAGELAAHRTDRHAIRAAGPRLIIGKDTAQSLAIALHELATNAVKHGALSVAGGAVALDWRVADSELLITWRETGGPAVCDIPRAGVGATVIDRTIKSQLGGALDYDWRSDGLALTLRVPIADAA